MAVSAERLSNAVSGLARNAAQKLTVMFATTSSDMTQGKVKVRVDTSNDGDDALSLYHARKGDRALVANIGGSLVALGRVGGERTYPVAGIVVPYARLTQAGIAHYAPDGWLWCNGASYNTSDFPELAEALYETGQGLPATFNVPDLTGRFVACVDPYYNMFPGTTGGERDHTLTEGEMPSHVHRFVRQQWYATDREYGEGGDTAIYSWKSSTGGTTSKSYYGVDVDEQYGRAGEGYAHNNMPPYYALPWMISAGRSTEAIIG